MINNLYTIGICGFAGAGKTTLLEILSELLSDLIMIDLDPLVFNARLRRKDEILDKAGYWCFNDDGTLTEDADTLIKLENAPKGTLTKINQIVSNDVLQYIHNLITSGDGTKAKKLAIGFTMIPVFGFWKDVDYKILLNTNFDVRREKLKQRGVRVYGAQLHIVDNLNEECYKDVCFNRTICNIYNTDKFRDEAKQVIAEIRKVSE